MRSIWRKRGMSKPLNFNLFCHVQFSSVAQLWPTLWAHGLQHARLPGPSPASRAYSNSCPSSQWCHPTISSSVIPSLTFNVSQHSFPMSQFFLSGGQIIGVSTSEPVLPMDVQDWFPLRRTGWISLLFKGPSRVFFNTTVQKHRSSAISFLYSPTLTSIHDHWKNHSLD